MRVILFFIDGLGLASAGELNPLWTTSTPCLESLLEGHSLTQEAVGINNEHATLLALDATLGVEGLPQSATGQTTLFTGVNAAQMVGRHISAFPTEPLRRILSDQGLLKKLTESGKTANFLNGYRPQFFLDLPRSKRGYSATTLLNLYAGLPFHTIEDIASGRALCMDMTNESFRLLDLAVPDTAAEEAGKILARNAQHYDFLLYEYFLTDKFAHKRDHENIARCITHIDNFLAGIISTIDRRDTLLIVTSDHGNIEDLSTSTHSLNPVPLLLIGAGRENLPTLTSLTEVTPLILQLLHH